MTVGAGRPALGGVRRADQRSTGPQLREPVFFLGTDRSAERWVKEHAPYLLTGRRWRLADERNRMWGTFGGTLVVLRDAPRFAAEMQTFARGRRYAVIHAP